MLAANRTIPDAAQHAEFQPWHLSRMHERALSRRTKQSSGDIEQSAVRQLEPGAWISAITDLTSPENKR